MDNETDSQPIFESAADKRRREDHDDLQNEMAGRDVGRLKRFFAGKAAGGGKAGAEDERAFARTLQWLLANDPAYAAYYAKTFALLEGAENATEEALEEAEAALDGLMDRAARLPDGRAVFMDENGDVRSESGALIAPALAAEIDWPENAPAYEDYRDARQRIDDLREYQVDVLGHARERLTDEKNPATMDEMEDINGDIRSGLNDIVHQKDHEDHKPEASHQLSSDIGVPTLGG